MARAALPAPIAPDTRCKMHRVSAGCDTRVKFTRACAPCGAAGEAGRDSRCILHRLSAAGNRDNDTRLILSRVSDQTRAAGPRREHSPAKFAGLSALTRAAIVRQSLPHYGPSIRRQALPPYGATMQRPAWPVHGATMQWQASPLHGAAIVRTGWPDYEAMLAAGPIDRCAKFACVSGAPLPAGNAGLTMTLACGEAIRPPRWRSYQGAQGDSRARLSPRSSAAAGGCAARQSIRRPSCPPYRRPGPMPVQSWHWHRASLPGAGNRRCAGPCFHAGRKVCGSIDRAGKPPPIGAPPATAPGHAPAASSDFRFPPHLKKGS